jgi:hypothetical protein
MVRLDNTGLRRNIVSSNGNDLCFRSVAIWVQAYFDKAVNWARTWDDRQGLVEIALQRISLVVMHWNNIVDWHTWYPWLARWNTNFEVVANGRRTVFHGQYSTDVSTESQKERRNSCKERGCISHWIMVNIVRQTSSFELAIDFALVLLLYVVGREGWRGRQKCQPWLHLKGTVAFEMKR